MTPFEQAEALYAGRPDMDFAQDLKDHMRYGYVLANPNCIAMIRPVVKDWIPSVIRLPWVSAYPETADCWFVWLLCGSLKEAVKHLPYRLPWVGFAQRGGPARFIDLEKALAKIG